MNPSESAGPAADGPPSRVLPLHDGEFAEIGGRIGDLARGRLPLVAGLRALSEELPSPRMRSTLREIALRMERGESLESVFQQSFTFPDDMAGVIKAGLHSGKLTDCLEQYLLLARSLGDRRRRILLAMAYPTFVVLVCAVFLAFFLAWVASDFEKIFTDFGVQQPAITQVLLRLASAIRRHWRGMLLSIVAVVLGIWSILRQVQFRRTLHRLLYLLPLVGSLLRYSSLSSFCNVLALLIENRVALPEALTIAAASTRDPALLADTQRVTAELNRGITLEQAGRKIGCYPEYLLHALRWEQHQTALSGGLRSVAEVFSVRADSQAELIGTIAQPVAIFATAVAIGTLVFAVFTPLFKLLDALT